MIPTVVRGHLARPGSPAEAHLLAWDALAWEAPSPDRLREELERVRASLAEARRQRIPLRMVPHLPYLERTLPAAVVAAEKRLAEAAACLLRAREAEGYLGEDPQPLHTVE